MAGYIPRWFTCPQTVTHPCINRVWRRVTSLITTNALPLSQTTNPLWNKLFWFCNCFNYKLIELDIVSMSLCSPQHLQDCMHVAVTQLRRERFIEDLENYGKQVEEFQTCGDMAEIQRYLKKAQALDGKLQAAADKVQL